MVSKVELKPIPYFAAQAVKEAVAANLSEGTKVAEAITGCCNDKLKDALTQGADDGKAKRTRCTYPPTH